MLLHEPQNLRSSLLCQSSLLCRSPAALLRRARRARRNSRASSLPGDAPARGIDHWSPAGTSAPPCVCHRLTCSFLPCPCALSRPRTARRVRAWPVAARGQGALEDLRSLPCFCAGALPCPDVPARHDSSSALSKQRKVTLPRAHPSLIAGYVDHHPRVRVLPLIRSSPLKNVRSRSLRPR